VVSHEALRGPDSQLVIIQYVIMYILLNMKGKTLVGALAVTKGLVGQVEGLLGNFPSILYGTNALVKMCTFIYDNCVR